MAVSNFYFTADIDGQSTTRAGGPKSRDGGLTIRLTQRDRGSIVTAASIECLAVGNRLVTRVFDNNGQLLAKVETER